MAQKPFQINAQDRRPIRISHNVTVQGYDAAIVPDYETLQRLADKEPETLRKATTYRCERHNLVVIAGLNYIVNRLTGTSTVAIGYCGVGSGTMAVSSADTALQTQIATRQAITNAYLGVTGKGHFDTFFPGVSTWNGTWNETGLFTESAASGTDVMLARLIINPFVKSTANTATVSWSVQFTPN